ncbi:hypothetical protein BT96DRAFT_912292 [Gymnopus androsaceus JB14]|uniref:F-box domain-containing protein n=1 Tax=Gymnopus androsaceus JB14 TaxID=1447944 RepID=A0A6A4ISL1_9AGAR|nr:hypothetical protein BT96DRAFT_912292 [Gymnopus androsaceus JB14]
MNDCTCAPIEHSSNCQCQEINQEAPGEEAYWELKSRHNLLAPVSKIPTETLCAIFMFLPRPEFSQLPFGDEDIKKIPILAVTQVCRKWRTVALECPALWRKPDFARPKWAREMIRLSKMAPLIVDLKTSLFQSEPSSDTLEAIVESWKHFPRTVEICLETYSPDTMDKLLVGTNHPAPLLDSLSLSIKDFHLLFSYGYADYNNSRYCQLPENLLGGNVPRLSRVELSRCHLSWDSPLLRNLTMLKVCNPGPPAPTLDQFVSVLASMPQLEVLELRDALPENMTTTSTQKPHVDLPRLRELRIVCTLQEWAIFLEHVVTSPKTIGALAVCSQPGSMGLINEVVHKTMPGVPFIRILILQMVETGVSVMARGRDLPLDTRPTSCHVPTTGWLEAHFNQFSDIRHQLDELVSEICSSLPLSQLNYLYFGSMKDRNLSAQTFVNVFMLMPRVNCLSVGESENHSFNAFALVTALHPPQTAIHDCSLSSTEPLHQALTLPSLRTLKLKQADFDQDCGNGNTLLSILRDCLVRRKELECGIHKLILEHCLYLTPKKVAELNKVVNVEWDKIELARSPHSRDEDDVYEFW